MLLARYFLSVGGVLLALLFVADAVVPKVPAAATDSNDLGTDKAVIRIHTDRKWPEPVVFDTNSRTTFVPAQIARPAAVVPPRARPADVPEKPRGREALAQLVAPDQKKAEAKPQQKRKIERGGVPPPMIQVAQQP